MVQSKKNIFLKSFIKEDETNKGLFFIKWPFKLTSDLFVDEDKKKFDHGELKEKDLVKIIVEISNLWIDGDLFGLAIVVRKVMVRPYRENLPSEYVFNDSEESDPDEKADDIISLLATDKKPQTRSFHNNINANMNTKPSAVNTAIRSKPVSVPSMKSEDKKNVPTINRNCTDANTCNTRTSSQRSESQQRRFEAEMKYHEPVDKKLISQAQSAFKKPINNFNPSPIQYDSILEMNEDDDELEFEIA